jgi:hypothetical protein
MGACTRPVVKPISTLEVLDLGRGYETVYAGDCRRRFIRA